MDFHGSPLCRTWVKLGATAAKGSTVVTLAEPVTGWRVGDRVILTATRTGPTRDAAACGTREAPLRTDAERASQTEERDRPGDRRRPADARPARWSYDHLRDGDYRGEVANLSRNVVVESADPGGVRGPHDVSPRLGRLDLATPSSATWARRACSASTASTSTALGDTMRGSSVVGASIWDSGNRWITIHGTNYLVVRDCVGYQ